MDNIQKMYLFWFLREFFLIGAITVPFFTQWGGLNYTQIFLLQAVFSLTLLLSQMPTGAFADKYGRKKSLALGCLISTIGFILYVMKADFSLFLVGEILTGLGLSFAAGADFAIAYDSLGSRKKAASRGVFTNSQIVYYLAAVLSAPLGSSIAYALSAHSPENFRFVMAISALPILAAGLVALTLGEKRGGARHKASIIKICWDGFAEVTRNPYLMVLVADRAVIGAAAFFMFWFYQSILAAHGVPVLFNGPVSSAFNLVSIALLAFFGFGLHTRLKAIESRFSAKSILLYSALGVGILYFAAAAAPSVWLALPAILIIPAMRAVREPVLLDLINQESGARRRATINSFAAMANSGALVLCYPLVGMLADMSLSLALAVLGFLALISALTTAALYRQHAPAVRGGSSAQAK